VTDLAPWQRQGSAQSGSAITKRVTHPLNGAGTTGELAAFTNFTHRWPILLTPTTSRWRLRIRNRDSVGGAAQTGALSFLGAGVQTPTFSGTGGWDGTLSAVVMDALGAFATASDGSEYTSAWVSDPSLQFTARMLSALSAGATLSAATPVVRSNTGQILRYSIDGTDAASQWSAAALTAGSPTTATGIGDIRLEYEFSTPAVGGIPVVLGIGDSILERIVGAGLAAFPHQSWLAVAGLRYGFAWINLGVGGALSADFVAGNDWRWARADLTTTVPDAAVIALGYNDANNGVSLATFKTNLNGVIATTRAKGINNIWLATVIPGNLDGTADPLRVSYNDYIRQLPLGVNGCVDHDLALRDPSDTSSPFTPLASLSSTPPHPLLGGYQALGAVSAIAS
jgi:hypothetical protein